MSKIDDHFPNGLRVLLVDDNINDMKMLYNNLQQCKYKVTATTESTKALELLRKNKDDYDILIIEAKLLDMDAFEFLKIITFEIDKPVIMVSKTDEREMVMKSVRNGAQDYLVKPIRMEELRNIWQHVLRKKLFDLPRSLTPMIRERENKTEKGPCAPKKPRVTWSKHLQDKFSDVVGVLGPDAVPMKIKELLNEPHLSRDQIASHLQKYRNALAKGKMNSAQTNQNKHLHLPLVSNKSQFFIPSPPQNSFIQQNQQHFGMVPTNYMAMPSPSSANFHQPAISTSTSVSTPNPSTWNRFNTTNIHSFPNMDSEYAVFRGPTNNHLIGLQPYPTSMNSFGDANHVLSQPPPTNYPNSLERAIPISSSGQNEGNVTKFDTPSMELGKTVIENPIHMGSGIFDENEWTKNGHMVYQQEQMERNNNDNCNITFDEDLMRSIKEYCNDDPSTM
ncbi:two-component response regulator ARR12-like [Impatiens glandulifera]|uniref:two-component response regulator ARR12-like n=1 Tax=Impatiens glandulifera TaxID=253017 RepID=UPI001FB0CA8B|nr:two-component response regulator ARR12-like [Impatiens glandulifera]